MGIENGVASEGLDVDLHKYHRALLSSSTKWRLGELSRLEQELKESSKANCIPPKLSIPKLKIYVSISTKFER